jgi:hypothetical protein
LTPTLLQDILSISLLFTGGVSQTLKYDEPSFNNIKQENLTIYLLGITITLLSELIRKGVWLQSRRVSGKPVTRLAFFELLKKKDFTHLL